MSRAFIETVSKLNETRCNTLINRLINEKISCGFFCFSSVASWKIDTALRLLKAGVNLRFICVVDDKMRDSLGMKGITVVTWKELETLNDKPQCMIYLPELYASVFDEYFYRIGIKDVFALFDPRKIENTFRFFMQHLPELYDVYQSFNDEESKTVYLCNLLGKLSGRRRDYHFATEPTYCLEGFMPTEGDIAIDGGVRASSKVRSLCV